MKRNILILVIVAIVILFGYISNAKPTTDAEIITNKITTLFAHGDSITVGVGVTNQANKWANKVAAFLKVPVINRAISGITMPYVAGSAYRITPNKNSIHVLLTGYNDLRIYGTSPYALGTYEESLRAALTYLSLPKENIFSGDLIGKLNDVKIINTLDTIPTVELKSNNSSISANVYGDTVYVGYTNRCVMKDGGSLIINIDKADVATIDTKNCQSNIIYPAVKRFDNLGDKLHTVTLKASITNNQVVDVLWIGSNNKQNKKDFAYVYSGGSIFATSTYAYSGNGSDNAVRLYNAKNKQVVEELSKDGLPVYYVDVNKYFNPWKGDMSKDSIHPNDKGNVNISWAFLNTINSTIAVQAIP